jgi:hypothetical protein
VIGSFASGNAVASSQIGKTPWSGSNRRAPSSKRLLGLVWRAAGKFRRFSIVPTFCTRYVVAVAGWADIILKPLGLWGVVSFDVDPQKGVRVVGYSIARRPALDF